MVPDNTLPEAETRRASYKKRIAVGRDLSFINSSLNPYADMQWHTQQVIHLKADL